MSNLADYLFRTRFFLRDSQSILWTDQQLTVCINQARRDMCADCGPTRDICQITFNQGQEFYPNSAVLAGLSNLGSPQSSAASIYDILDLKLFYTTVYKPPLLWRPWTRFSQIHRGYDYQMIPAVWSRQAFDGFYVRPIPNMTYICEVRSVWLPADLQNVTDTEIFFGQPFVDLVPMLAASYATEYRQDKQRAYQFKLQYIGMRDERLGALPAFRVPSYYSRSAA